MNAIKSSACLLAAAALCATSCGQKDQITVLGGGYETAAHTQRSFLNEPESLKVKLYYRTSEGKRVLVWPILHSEVFIKDGVAVFAGSRAVGRSKLDNNWQMKLRLFAVRAPGAPMDITPEIIGRWAKESGKDIATVVKTASLLGAQASMSQISCYFGFDNPDWHETDILLNWNRVLELMQEVKEKGSEHKDPELGTIYLEKE